MEVSEAVRIEVARLDLRPGDRLLLRYPPGVKPDELRPFVNEIKRLFPGIAGVVCISTDFELTAIRAAPPIEIEGSRPDDGRLRRG